MKLLIDDKRDMLAEHIDVIARNALIGIAILEHIYVNTLYLDHDLGHMGTICLNMVDELEATGYGVLLWLEMPDNADRRPETIILVTDNPVGRAKMELALSSIGYHKHCGQWKLPKG